MSIYRFMPGTDLIVRATKGQPILASVKIGK
jgi:hypothetical protein